MKIVGLCGGSGSGKGVVSQLFLKYGIASIDTDAVYHALVSFKSELLDELAAAFGSSIIKNGVLDRAQLSEIVFGKEGKEEQRKKLNSISHKHILLKTQELIEKYRQSGAAAVLVDAPLLFEAEFDKMCDVILAVVADRELRVARIVKRDGITRERAQLRIDAQLSDSELIARSHYVIENNGDFHMLEENVGKIAKILLEKDRI